MSPDAQKLLSALRKNAEGSDIIPSDDDVAWQDVYLDNATFGLGIERRSLPGMFAALSKAGLYREVDNYAWGMVRMEDR